MTVTRLQPSSVSTTKLPKVGRLLIIGAAGFIGQFVAEASLDSGRPTYVLVRPGLGYPSSKANTIKSLQDKGAIILHVKLSPFSCGMHKARLYIFMCLIVSFASSSFCFFNRD